MKIIREISEIKDIHNWFIVDVGYSNSRKSCGTLLVKNDKCTNENLEDIAFSELKIRFQKFHTECNNTKIGLILEAPLSIAFDKEDGSPLGRKDIEKEKSATRYWYYGAGATVTLGALEFINRIKKILLCDNNIYLFEGFVSFKKEDSISSKLKKLKWSNINESLELLDYQYQFNELCKKSKQVSKSKGNHYDDARLLYCGIKDENMYRERIFPEDDEKYIFIGDYLNLKIDGIPPIVKISKEKKSEIYMLEL